MGSKVKEIYPELKVGDRICEWSWCEGFAEYVRIDTRQIATLAPLPGNVSDEEGAVLELAGGSTIVYAWAAVKPLDKVLVLGCGPAGLCIIQHAKNFGAEAVVATDIYENRLRLAKKLGADGAYNASEHDPDELGRLIKREFGAMDVVIDTAGSSKAVFTGTEALKPGGPFYIFAHVSEHVTIPYMRVATKLGHFGHPTNWPDRARLFKELAAASLLSSFADPERVLEEDLESPLLRLGEHPAKVGFDQVELEVVGDELLRFAQQELFALPHRLFLEELDERALSPLDHDAQTHRPAALDPRDAVPLLEERGRAADRG
jgi:threonine dehydrogenase-like Zn-dependent dehydrogenase